jgi:mRNA-degrading endonuclease RelE of RelBE toxin-antitoxin system
MAPDGAVPGRPRQIGGWRIRVGDDRVIYTIRDVKRVVDVTAVRHRRDAYR